MEIHAQRRHTLFTVRIAPPAGTADPEWLALRLRLWPSEDEAELRHEMADMLARGHFVRLAYAADGAAIGLVEASQRVDCRPGVPAKRRGARARRRRRALGHGSRLH